ncbi:class I SAM-dependent methyltransferase [Guggenheimella bovis]
MNTHYYTNNSELKSAEKTIQVKLFQEEYSFITDHGVFSKDRLDYGSEVLIKAVEPFIKGEVLDYGAGYGPIGIILMKRKGIKATFVEINDRAVSLIEKNLVKNNLKGKVLNVETLQGLGPFDYVLLNPPIRTGKDSIYSMFREAKEVLKEGGSLILVIQKKQGLESAKKELQTMFSNIETIERSSGYHVLKCTL